MKNSFVNLDKTNVMVDFRISGEDFDPQFITESLNIIPDESWRKGEKVEAYEDDVKDVMLL